MKQFQSTDQDYELWVLLAQVRAAMFKARQEELRQYDLTARQAAVLFVIQAIGDKATPAEISRWLFRESHSVSDLLKRMENRGLVNKVKDLHRKNLVRIELTEKGREIYNQSIKRESIHSIMSSLSEDKRQQLRSYLQTLRDKALKENGINSELPFPLSG